MPYLERHIFIAFYVLSMVLVSVLIFGSQQKNDDGSLFGKNSLTVQIIYYYRLANNHQ